MAKSQWELDLDKAKASEAARAFGIASGIGLFVSCLIIAGMVGCPKYSVWEQGQVGKAELAKASFNRQIKVQEAEAALEASKSLAQADVERAKGVAQSNQIIGNSLKQNEDYLKWLYIEALKEKTGAETIYVPTEAGLPILEAGRRK